MMTNNKVIKKKKNVIPNPDLIKFRNKVIKFKFKNKIIKLKMRLLTLRIMLLNLN